MRTHVSKNGTRDVAVVPRRRWASAMTRRRWRLGALGAAAMLALGTPTAATSAGSPPTAHSAFAPAATSWLSPVTGFVLGEGACAPRPSNCTSILATRDGGRTFTREPGPPVPLTPQDPAAVLAVSRLVFVSLQVGYAWGPGLWMTTDGARHWTVLAPTNVVAVLPSAQAVDVLAQTCAASAPSCASPGLVVWRAPLGGVRMSRVARLAGTGQWMSAQQGQVGVIALTSLPPIGSSQLWRTENGGVTWSVGDQPCSQLAQMSPGAVTVTRGGSILVVCAGSPGTGQQSKVLFASSDGGTTFVDVGPVPLTGGLGQVAAYGVDVVALTATSGAGEIDVSADGGLHYVTTTLAGGGASLTNLAWTSPTSAVVVEGGPGVAGPDRLLVSHDGGVHWATLPLTLTAPAPPVTARAVWPGAVRIQPSAATACLYDSRIASTPCLEHYLLAHGAPKSAVAFVQHYRAYLIAWRPGAINFGEELTLVPEDCGCRTTVLVTSKGRLTLPFPRPGGPGWTALARWYPLPTGGSGLGLAGFSGWVESDPATGNTATLQYPLLNMCSACIVPYRLRVLVRLDAAGVPEPAVSLGPCLLPGATHPPDRNVPRCPPVEAWLG